MLPQLIGEFIPAIDMRSFASGFGMIIPWGGGRTIRESMLIGAETLFAGGEVTESGLQISALVNSLMSPPNSVNQNYYFEGLVGPQGVPGRPGPAGFSGLQGVGFPGITGPTGADGGDITADVPITNGIGWAGSGAAPSDIEQTTDDANGTVGDSGDVEYRYTQSFTTGGSTFDVAGLSIKFGANSGSPSGGVTFTIETDSAGDPSGSLVHANATKAITPTPSAWNTVTFPAVFELAATTTYWIVATPDESQSTNVHWTWRKKNDNNPYGGGQVKYSIDLGGWISQANNDMAFKVQYDGTTIAWTTGNLRYEGTDYTIAAGSTNNTYVYWNKDSSPTTFQTTSTLSTAVGTDKWLMALYDDGAVYPAFSNRVIHGGVIQASTITAVNIAANTITAAKIAAGTITASEITANTITYDELRQTGGE